MTESVVGEFQGAQRMWSLVASIKTKQVHENKPRIWVSGQRTWHWRGQEKPIKAKGVQRGGFKRVNGLSARSLKNTRKELANIKDQGR